MCEIVGECVSGGSVWCVRCELCVGEDYLDGRLHEDIGGIVYSLEPSCRTAE